MAEQNLAINSNLQAKTLPRLLAGPIKTTCPYCGVGCGIDITQADNSVNTEQTVHVNGDKRHPANFGKLCIKGKSLGDTLSNDNRLALPKINGHTQKWPKTLDYVASQLMKTIEEFGRDSVAFYTSGQLLTEDYYLANKLMKGFIGSSNIDTNSRLCMSSAVSAHKRAFGEDIVPMSYSDITQADLLVLAGSNLAWCHPVIYQRIREEKEKRPALKVVVIDPRVTATTELADYHLAIKAGSDLKLFNGLLSYLDKNGFIDRQILAIDGLEDALQLVHQESGNISNDQLGLPSAAVDEFYQLFATNEKVVTIFSQGINQSVQGTNQGNAIINCHLASGKIGKTGCGPFSITGQPNAMGGREVGALANTLASHIDFPNSETSSEESEKLHNAVADFWQTDCLATQEGLKAVDLFNAVDEGKIKAIWIMATNPLVSMPEHNKIARALTKCPLVIVSDCVESNDTLQFANVILPAQSWGEKSGMVTNSERRISRQRPFLLPFGQAKPDWWIISEVAKRMGFSKQFNYSHVSDIFAEHARLSGLHNNGNRAFDISTFGAITAKQYEVWQPVQWPQPKGESICLNDQGFFANGRYYRSNKKAKIFAFESSRDKNEYDNNKIFTLNTGRNRDQWHTQTRSGKSSILSNRHPEPEVSINPKDALLIGVKEAQLVTVSTIINASIDKSLISNEQRLVVRAKLTKAVQENTLFMPIHWSSSNFNQGCVSQLIKTEVDKVSGQPAFKHGQVHVNSCPANSEALLVVKTPISDLGLLYQVEQKITGGFCYHIASSHSPHQLFNLLEKVIQSQPSFNQALDNLNASEPLKQYFRKSYLNKGQLDSAILVSTNKSELPQGWISKCYQLGESLSDKRDLISNCAKKLQQKKTFCQCLNIDVQLVEDAIKQGKLTVEQVRDKTGAGNGCGSCIGDIALTIQGVNV